MLELLLNLIWFLLAVGLWAGLAWSLRRARGRSEHAHSAVERCIAALVLTFVLLPVISMTDDLQSIATVEERESGVRAQVTNLLREASVRIVHLPQAGMPAVARREGWQRIEILSFAGGRRSVRAVSPRLYPKRAPPVRS